MTERKGLLPKSPLIATLASVKFASWPLLGQKIAEIHDELREHLPLIQNIKVAQGFLMGGGASVPSEDPAAWVLLSSDRLRGCLISQDQLLFMSKAYTQYHDFSETFRCILEVLLKHMRFLDVTQIGTRYIDHIKVRAGETADMYISSSLLAPKIPRLERSGGVVMGMYTTGAVELRVRSVSQPGALAMPEDVIPMIVMMNGQDQPLQLVPLAKEEILLDMDALQQYPTPQRYKEVGAISQKLENLHTVANAFFRREDVCSDHAFKVWKEEA